MEERQAGVPLQPFLEGDDRLGHAALLLQRLAQVDDRLRQARLQADGRPVAENGETQLAAAPLRIAEVAVGARHRRIETDRPPIGRLRGADVAARGQHVAGVEPAVGLAGLQGQRHAHRRDGLGAAPLLLQRAGEVAAHRRILRPGRDRVAVMRGGLGPQPFSPQQDGEVVVGVRVVGVACQHRAIAGLRVFEPPGLVMGERGGETGVRVGRHPRSPASSRMASSRAAERSQVKRSNRRARADFGAPSPRMMLVRMSDAASSSGIHQSRPWKGG